MTLTEIKTVLAQRGLRPLKQLGQNFLFDQNICRQVVASIRTDGAVYEIGPGLGSLTEYLLAEGREVTAFEIDKGLCVFLRERFENAHGFRLVEGDALEQLTEKEAPRIVVGNLPYHVTTPLLARVMSYTPLPLEMVYTVQKEAAQRMAAQVGDHEYGAISVLLSSFYEVESIRSLPGRVFYPEPKVESTVVRLTRKETGRSVEAEAFYRFLRRGFMQRRKKLKNVLPVDLDKRAQELDLEDWWELYHELG